MKVRMIFTNRFDMRLAIYFDHSLGLPSYDDLLDGEIILEICYQQ